MKKRIERGLAFLPLVLLMGGAYLIPILSNLGESLRNEAGEYVGLQNYADVWNSYYFLDSLWFTLKIALITTLISTVLAIMVAMALRETFFGKKLVLFLFQYNLCVPHMAVAMMMIMLLSQTGLVSTLSNLLGITAGAEDFPWLIRDSRGVGIILTFVWKYFPYIGLSALGILQGASLEYEQQAACLGVGKYRRFFHILLPNIIPAITVAMIMVFTASFGEYEIPALLGESGCGKTTLLKMIAGLEHQEAGTILAAAPQGVDTRCVIECAGLRLTLLIRNQDDHRWAVGDEISFGIDPLRIWPVKR